MQTDKHKKQTEKGIGAAAFFGDLLHGNLILLREKMHDHGHAETALTAAHTGSGAAFDTITVLDR